MRIHRGKKTVEFTCTLHKIPALLINFEPTETHLILHTLRYSKKYFLKTKYPEGVTVHAGDFTEASLENGILRSSIPITSELPEPQILGKRNKQETTAESPPPKKQKKEIENKKKTKVEKDQKVKAKASLKSKKKDPENDDQETSTEEEPKKQKKQFVTKKSALELVDQVNEVVEEKINKKIEKEKSKAEWMAERKAVREKRKKTKQEKKQNEVEDIIKSLKKQKKQKKEKQESVADAEEKLPLPNELGLKSILKKKDVSVKKGRVSFSPTVQIQPIPRVKNPTPISLTLSRMQLRSQMPQRKKPSRKARLYKKR